MTKSSAFNPDFWRGKRVFLTGHTGFKGAWMTQLLDRLSATVHGFALEPDRTGAPQGVEPLFCELGLADKIERHSIGDVRDRKRLRAAMLDADPEIVIHMAAQPLVRFSYQHPVETYETNVMGTVHLLDACRQLANLRSVFIVSSDKCYENKEQIWGYREDDPMGGYDPYSSSKGCTEIVTSAFRRSYFHPAHIEDHGVSVASGRAGNVIGGGDWSVDRLIPDAMRAYMAGEAFIIRNPRSVRPWQHVLDWYLPSLSEVYF